MTTVAVRLTYSKYINTPSVVEVVVVVHKDSF